MINAYAINPNIAAKYEHRLALIMQRHVQKEGHGGKMPKMFEDSFCKPGQGRRYDVLDYLKANGPQTARQIAEAFGVERHKIGCDLQDLRRDGRADRVHYPGKRQRNTIWRAV